MPLPFFFPLERRKKDTTKDNTRETRENIRVIFFASDRLERAREEGAPGVACGR